MRTTAKRGLSLFVAVVMLLSAAAVMTVPVGAAATLYWPVPGHTNYSNRLSDATKNDSPLTFSKLSITFSLLAYIEDKPEFILLFG